MTKLCDLQLTRLGAVFLPGTFRAINKGIFVLLTGEQATGGIPDKSC